MTKMAYDRTVVPCRTNPKYAVRLAGLLALWWRGQKVETGTREDEDLTRGCLVGGRGFGSAWLELREGQANDELVNAPRERRKGRRPRNRTLAPVRVI